MARQFLRELEICLRRPSGTTIVASRDESIVIAVTADEIIDELQAQLNTINEADRDE